MTSLGGGYGGHLGAIIAGGILLVLALGTSFLIPKAAGEGETVS